jgi:hypothetical protein
MKSPLSAYAMQNHARALIPRGPSKSNKRVEGVRVGSDIKTAFTQRNKDQYIAGKEK